MSQQGELASLSNARPVIRYGIIEEVARVRLEGTPHWQAPQIEPVHLIR